MKNDKMYPVRDKRQILADFVRTERTRKKLSQTELADKMGKVRAIVNKIESGSTEPTLDTLQDLARGLEIPLTTILNLLGYDVGVENADLWVEEMNYKMNLVPQSSRPVLEKLLDALIEEPAPAPKTKKAKANA